MTAPATGGRGGAANGDDAAEILRSRIWQEQAEPDNPFVAAVCRCHGYDVYGDLLGKAGWADYLYLLFHGQAPTASQARSLEGLAVVLANPGPRDPGVHAAMAGGVGGAPAAACLMAALAVGAGGNGGALEVRRAMANMAAWGTDLAAWRSGLVRQSEPEADTWPAPEHPPGFDPHGASCATPVRQALAYLAGIGAGPMMPWLATRRPELETVAKLPLAMSAVAAATLHDLGFSPAQGEMATLMLRLPGAAVHALEQGGYGYKRFPFFKIMLLDDPAREHAHERT